MGMRGEYLRGVRYRVSGTPSPSSRQRIFSRRLRRRGNRPHLRCSPSAGRQFPNRPVCGRGQTCEHTLQIREGKSPPAVAACHKRVHDRATVPRMRLSNEQPVFLPHRRPPDRPFTRVVVDLHPSATQLFFCKFKWVERAVRRLGIEIRGSC